MKNEYRTPEITVKAFSAVIDCEETDPAAGAAVTSAVNQALISVGNYQKKGNAVRASIVMEFK